MFDFEIQLPSAKSVHPVAARILLRRCGFIRWISVSPAGPDELTELRLPTTPVKRMKSGGYGVHVPQSNVSQPCEDNQVIVPGWMAAAHRGEKPGAKGGERPKRIVPLRGHNACGRLSVA